MEKPSDRQVNAAVEALVAYAAEVGLIAGDDPDERVWARNSVLEVLGRTDFESAAASAESAPRGALADILRVLTDDAVARGIISEDTTTRRDLFDTAIMGRLTPPPGEVSRRFRELAEQGNTEAATDWFYRFSHDTNYIRRDRMEKQLAWKAESPYGVLDLTINLAKPEKDPRDIAAARTVAQSSYPACALCVENIGFAGDLTRAARQNHRVIPLRLDGEPFRLQYSPYLYYPEHSIVLREQHVPMRIGRDTFAALMSFVHQFPHYFVGSNADLPVVGGSILSHDHFQGGRFEFAMDRAPFATAVSFTGFEDVTAGIVDWPMSVLRLTCADPDRLVDLACRVTDAWRVYTDEAAFVFAETDGEPHNTVTPVARRRGDLFELDLVLRNNITTDEHPLGVYHPHAELHHLKKENIGLIEVMGLAVLPARLEEELSALSDALLTGADLTADPRTASHAEWAESFRDRVSESDVTEVIREEVGREFARVLEHAGVFRRTDEGFTAFRRFVDAVNG